MLASHSRAIVFGTAAIVGRAAFTATIHRTPRERKSIHSRSRETATANTGIASALTGQILMDGRGGAVTFQDCFRTYGSDPLSTDALHGACKRRSTTVLRTWDTHGREITRGSAARSLQRV